MDHALTDEEYKFNIGEGYVFFEIVEPTELSYTYKVNPASFSPPWVHFIDLFLTSTMF